MAETVKKKPFLTALAAVLLLTLIISTGVVLTLHLRFIYYNDIKALHIEEMSGMPEEKIRENYDVLIDYNLVWNQEPLRFPDFPMSVSGETHFREVKRIFDVFQILFAVSVAGMAVLWIKAKSLRNGLYARITGYCCFGIVAALGLFALIGWDRLFVVFHKVFFNNDFWLFDYTTDPVITILPDTFFLHEAILILAVVLTGGALALIFGIKVKYRGK
nr:TIGR01906 family membrane protein [Lachnospiraceae bacterium]